jgi:hypothetical protein
VSVDMPRAFWEDIRMTKYDVTVIHPAIMNGLSAEVLDDILRDVNEYAGDDLEMSGVECLEECQSIMDTGPRNDLFYVLFDREIEAYEDTMFLNLIHKLIAHAGDADNDLLND